MDITKMLALFEERFALIRKAEIIPHFNSLDSASASTDQQPWRHIHFTGRECEFVPRESFNKPQECKLDLNSQSCRYAVRDAVYCNYIADLACSFDFLFFFFLPVSVARLESIEESAYQSLDSLIYVAFDEKSSASFILGQANLFNFSEIRSCIELVSIIELALKRNLSWWLDRPRHRMGDLVLGAEFDRAIELLRAETKTSDYSAYKYKQWQRFKITLDSGEHSSSKKHLVSLMINRVLNESLLPTSNYAFHHIEYAQEALTITFLMQHEHPRQRYCGELTVEVRSGND